MTISPPIIDPSAAEAPPMEAPQAGATAPTEFQETLHTLGKDPPPGADPPSDKPANKEPEVAKPGQTAQSQRPDLTPIAAPQPLGLFAEPIPLPTAVASMPAIDIQTASDPTATANGTAKADPAGGKPTQTPSEAKAGATAPIASSEIAPGPQTSSQPVASIEGKPVADAANPNGASPTAATTLKALANDPTISVRIDPPIPVKPTLAALATQRIADAPNSTVAALQADATRADQGALIATAVDAAGADDSNAKSQDRSQDRPQDDSPSDLAHAVFAKAPDAPTQTFETGQAGKAQVDAAKAAALTAQIADHVEALALSRGAGSVTVRLHPADLGSIVVTVRSFGTNVEAQIAATNDGVRQALAQRQNQLGQALSDRGMTLTKVSVSAPSTSTGLAADQDRQRGSNQAGGQRQGTANSTSTSDDPAPMRPGRSSLQSGNGLDLSI